MRVLLSAYQCGPGMGSVSQIGWEWYSRLARRTSVTLFTHIRNRPALEAAGGTLGQANQPGRDRGQLVGTVPREVAGGREQQPVGRNRDGVGDTWHPVGEVRQQPAQILRTCHASCSLPLGDEVLVGSES